MKKIELLQNIENQTYKFNKYDFIIKLENQGYYFIGYKWNHNRTYVVSTYECGSIYSSLESVKEMINYLVTDKIF
jgi:hypothetical protein